MPSWLSRAQAFSSDDTPSRDEPSTDATSPMMTASIEHATRGPAAGWPRWPAAARSPLALGHDDRERVVDDERADEEGDAGEDEQQDVEERQALLELSDVLLGDLLAGEHLEVRVAAAPARTRCGELLLADGAVALGERRCRSRPGLPTKLSAVARSNRAKVAPPGESASPNFTTPTSGNCRLPPWLDDRDLVADAKSPFLELPASIDDLVRPAGKAALGEPPRRQRRRR